ncbi:MAG: aldolase/citrate lyase family protein [Clostridia bacterium]|nr:aldolase/citrate lyase family protein [Clostridia bacterium]
MDKLRRTMLYVPGNNPGMLRDAGIYGADSLMFDLEDSIALTEKVSARFMVHHAIGSMDYGDTEIVVRINSLESGLGREDIHAVVSAGVDVIRLPKTETPQNIKDVEEIIDSAERQYNRPVGSTKIMAAVESPLGVMNAYAIATASPRIIGIAIGAEDFVTNMYTKRSDEGAELMVARSQILMAARAAKIYAIDTVYSDVDNEEGLRHEVEQIKQLGFDGKSIINPRQVNIVHDVFAPSKEEVMKAKRIQQAANEALEKGLGVISLDGKMIDKPIVDRAERLLSLAMATES